MTVLSLAKARPLASGVVILTYRPSGESVAL
jgi:hypothetical protein